jgi:hypothetical protein
VADRESVGNGESDVVVAGRIGAGENIDETVPGCSAGDVRVLWIDHEAARSGRGCEIDVLLGLRAENLPERIITGH